MRRLLARGHGWLIAATAIVGLGGVARADGPAPAPVREIIVKLDDTVAVGELVEKVVGDHITIKLDDGTTKRFAWADIKDAHAATAPAPTPVPVTGSATANAALAKADTESALYDGDEPDRRTPPYMRSNIVVGVTAAFDTPLVLNEVTRYSLGLTGGWDPTTWLEFEVGVGSDTAGEFGLGFSQQVRVGVPVTPWIRLGVGAGFGERATASAYTAVGAPSAAYFFTPDAFYEQVIWNHIRVRFDGTLNALLNSSGFNSVCTDGTTPAPCGVMQSGTRSSSFTVALEVAWLFGY